MKRSFKTKRQAPAFTRVAADRDPPIHWFPILLIFPYFVNIKALKIAKITLKVSKLSKLAKVQVLFSQRLCWLFMP